MRRPIHSLLAGSLIVLATVACNKDDADKKAAAAPAPVFPVKVAEVVARDVPIFAEVVGQTRGNEEIEISARVEGFLETMNFKEGSFVKKGQVLYTIDSRPFRASVAQARASAAQAQADLVRKQQDVKRYEPLVAKNAVSVQEYETAVAEEKAQESAVAAARASADRAQVELGYTTVLAPDDGLIGKTEVHPGTLVGRGSTTILSHMSKVDPIAVRFSISEREYLSLARRRDAREKDGGVPDGGAASDTSFQLILADGSVHSQPGHLSFVDRNVDPTTGTIMIEAAFPNPGNVVRPGQFAKVRASTTTKKGAVLVPVRAVADQQGVTNVAVVKADDTVEIRMIKTAERVGDLWIVESGIKPGERIVVEGLQKVRPGAKVKPELVPLEELAKLDGAAASSAPAPSASVAGASDKGP
jgi:membrane fusion protein (multidrug efflux system)